MPADAPVTTATCSLEFIVSELASRSQPLSFPSPKSIAELSVQVDSSMSKTAASHDGNRSEPRKMHCASKRSVETKPEGAGSIYYRVTVLSANGEFFHKIQDGDFKIQSSSDRMINVTLWPVEQVRTPDVVETVIRRSNEVMPYLSVTSQSSSPVAGKRHSRDPRQNALPFTLAARTPRNRPGSPKRKCCPLPAHAILNHTGDAGAAIVDQKKQVVQMPDFVQ